MTKEELAKCRLCGNKVVEESEITDEALEAYKIHKARLVCLPCYFEESGCKQKEQK